MSVNGDLGHWVKRVLNSVCHYAMQDICFREIKLFNFEYDWQESLQLCCLNEKLQLPDFFNF